MHVVGQAKPHFIITDPLAEDNPIVFASSGFFELSGYSASEVLGHNCRFLQGPATNPDTIDEIRKAVLDGSDCHVVLLNYRKDGTPFWNDLFIAPLRDPAGTVVHFVGIQSNVSEERARELLALKKAAQTHPQAAAALSAAQRAMSSTLVPSVTARQPQPPSAPPSTTVSAASAATVSSMMSSS
jgi:PAS domain S-box-containing protein